MIPVPPLDALRPQIAASLAGKIPAWAVDEATDLAVHAVDRAIASFNTVMASSSDPRLQITSAGIAISIIAQHFADCQQAIESVARKSGMSVHHGSVQL